VSTKDNMTLLFLENGDMISINKKKRPVAWFFFFFLSYA
jgi:hypothetical protein